MTTQSKYFILKKITKKPKPMSMTLPPELETRIQQQAVRAGLSVEAWLQQQVFRQELEGYAPLAASLQDELTPEEWVRQFHAWAEGQDCTTPLLSDEAISRENIYPDLYQQKQPEETLQSMSEQLITLQRSYTLLSEGSLIADVLAQVPSLYSLLKAAVEPLRIAFGDTKLLQLEALASDDDTVLRVIVKLSHGIEKPGTLMRKFKRDWWFKNCSCSEASLVFDYEIGNGF